MARPWKQLVGSISVLEDPNVSAEKRVLITGAAGFVGSHLVEHFQEQGYKEVFGTSMEKNAWLEEKLGPEHTLQIDLTNQEAVTELLARIKPDWIVHLAGIATVGESFDKGWPIMETNAKLQYVMLEAMRKSTPEARLLSIGSAHAYGAIDFSIAGSIPETTPFEPANPYAVSKLTQEYLSVAFQHAFQLNVILVRPFNQIGTRQTDAFAVPAFAKQIVLVEQGKQTEIKVGNLDAIRDFTDIRDAVRAYEVLLEKGRTGQAYNLGSGQGVKMQQLLDSLIKQAKTAIKVTQDPARMRPSDVPVFVANISKLKELGWQPQIPLEKTLSDILEYERKSAQL